MNKELAWPIAWEEEGRIRKIQWSHWSYTLETLAGKPNGNIQNNRDGLA